MYDVIILGSGPAGLTAAIYAQRFGLKTVVAAGTAWGGQLMLTTDVENWPGTRHIQGPQLMRNMRAHAEEVGAEIIDDECLKLEGTFPRFIVTVGDKQLKGKTVIIATGQHTRWLGVPNEDRFRGRGISSCAPCDAFFFRGKNVAVVGGGDSAMEEAQVLAKVAADVIIIHRRDEFRAQKAMVDKVTAMPNVKFIYNSQVVDVVGEQTVSGIILKTEPLSPKQNVASLDELISTFGGTKREDGTWILPRHGVFVAIGHVPNTNYFTNLERDSHGYVKRYEEKDDHGGIKYVTKTSVPGIFTAGDVHDARCKQAITAAGFGCMAAIDVQRWLAERGS